MYARNFVLLAEEGDSFVNVVAVKVGHYDRAAVVSVFWIFKRIARGSGF